MLNENGALPLKDEDVADTSNKYSGSIVESLNFSKWESEVTDFSLNDSNQDYLDLINIQVYKWLNRILEFLKSFHFN